MAGSDAGHAFTVLGLASAFVAEGDAAVVYTGLKWVDAARRRGLEVRDLPGLAARADDDDFDAGAKLSTRAARMALELAPLLESEHFDLVVSDSITLAGGWAAELCGIPWIELSSHPLYDQSRGLPPIGAGLDVGAGWRGRVRDALLRVMSRPAERKGREQRRRARFGIGLSAVPAPAARFVATLPGLEVARPDWPEWTHLIGPQFFEPTDDLFAVPAGDGPLIVVCPSTAESGNDDFTPAVLAALAGLAAQKPRPPGDVGEVPLPVAGRGRGAGRGLCRDLTPRLVYSALTAPPAPTAPTALADVEAPMVSGLGRQDRVLVQADLVICGGGHGLLAKALTAGVPTVMVPGGGDQWELACRVQRAGAGVLVRPATREAVASAVQQVLDDPSYAVAAARIGATVTQVSDPVRLAHRVIDESKRERSRAEESCD